MYLIYCIHNHAPAKLPHTHSHAGELDVSAYVRVVNIDLVAATKERHNRVVHLCQHRRREPQDGDRANGLLEEVPAACRRLGRHGRGGAETEGDREQNGGGGLSK